MRLDSALVTRGLLDSRTKAHRRILSGDVSVDGVPVLKPSFEVSEDADLVLSGGGDYVGRGALKLKAALDTWKVDVRDKRALDVGASTGGFTEILLEHGARSVVALDVGHGQLHPRLAEDPRVDSREGVNVRELSAQWWVSEVGVSPDLVTCDVSFISLTQVIPAVIGAVGLCDWIVLVKPQFEVGKGGVKVGIVLDPQRREKALSDVVSFSHDHGLGVAGLMASPIAGESGNREYLCWLSPTHGHNPPQWSQHIHELAHS
jgi:23S rRNA (cytidine1920-2'-O)/16S rRNA (cytidine1409-2'-O)-methyltransferase